MGKKIILICFLLLFSLSNSKLEENFVQLPMNVICSNLEDPLNEAFLFGKDEFSFKTDYLDTSNIFDSQKIEADTQRKEHGNYGPEHGRTIVAACGLPEIADQGVDAVGGRRNGVGGCCHGVGGVGQLWFLCGFERIGNNGSPDGAMRTGPRGNV